MKSRFYLFLILIPILFSCSGFEQYKQKVKVDTSVSESINSFNEKMFHQMYAEGENLAFSGTSIYNLLYLISNASGGETSSQIKDILGTKDSKNDAQIQKYFSDLENNYNSVWVQKGLSVKNNYSDFSKNLNSRIFSVDFNKTFSTKNKINKYIKKATENEIPKFLEDNLPADTKLCFLNALYFNQKWQKPFKKDKTTMEDFYGAQEQTSVALMMHESDFYIYTENESFQIVQLDYDDKDYSMICILPVDKEYDFSKIELNNLLSFFYENCNYESVKVSIPKFNSDIRTDLKKQLSDLGITNIFNSSCDFSNIFENNENVFIDEILHETKVSVDEEKTKAVAVTISFAKSANYVGQPDFYFNANHPFCYVIKDNINDIILFTGIVNRL